MKKFIPLFCLLLLLGAGNGFAQNGFTQEDRDRIIRTEAKIEEMNKRFEQRFEQVDKRFEQMDKRFTELREDMNVRLEQTDKRIDELRSDMKWQFGVLFSGMFILVGFILWDRRTTIAPLEARVKLIEQMQDEQIQTLTTNKTKLKNLIEALQTLGREDTKVAQVLKQFNLV